MVSGSSSLLLESESSESLAGRLDMLRLPPPDFRDCMTINRLEPPPEFKINPGLAKIPNDFVLYYGKNQARLAREYLDYLRWGGFPQLKDIIEENVIWCQSLNCELSFSNWFFTFLSLFIFSLNIFTQ